MNREASVDIRANSEAIGKMIEACNSALGGVVQLIHALQLSGQSPLKWADDPVSHDVAGHYVDQLWAGGYCTYSSVDNYRKELLSTIEALQRTLADYNNFDHTTADSLEQQ
jgi:hypothetical protein